MTWPSRNLTTYLPWTRVLELAGQPAQPRLPAQLTCPSCQGRLVIDADPAYRSQWFACRSCGAAGDMVELLARLWQVQPDIVLPRLLGMELLPAEVTGVKQCAYYLRAYVGRRQLLRDYWQALQQDSLLYRSGDARAALQGAGIHLPDPTLWAPMTELVAAADGAGAAAMFQPPERRRSRQTAASAVLADWGDILVVPFWDMPGRLRGCWCSSRTGQVLLQHFGAMINTLDTDTGLAFLPALLELPAGQTKRYVFDRDVLLALRLQALHTQRSPAPLPLAVAWQDEHGLATDLERSPLAGEPFIFWARQPSLPLFRWARATDGRIALDSELPGPLASRLGYYGAAGSLRYLDEHAQPWLQVLARHLVHFPELEAERLLGQLRLSQLQLAALGAAAPTTVNTIVRLAPVLTVRHATVDHVLVSERGDGWYSGKHRLSAARVRIDTAALDANGRVIYTGRILYGAQSLPFRVPATTLDHSGLRWVASQIVQAGLPPLLYDFGWTRRLVALALAFATPEVARRIGYVDGAIQLAHYSLQAGGVVAPVAVPPFDTQLPTYQLEPPAPLRDADWPALLAPAARSAWPTAVAVLSNVLAPAFGLPPAGIALVGRAAALVGPLAAAAAGCSTYTPSNAIHAECVAGPLEQAHGWPVRIRPPVRMPPRAIMTWLGSAGPRNAVAALSLVQALAAPHGWHIVEDDMAVYSTPVVDGLARLVPAFLAWLLERKLELPAAPCLGLRVATALLTWCAAVGRGATPIAEALLLLDHDQSHTRQAAAAACQRLRRLCLVLAATRAGQTRPFIEPAGPGKLFVAQACLNRALDAAHAPVLDEVAVTAHLEATGLLCGRHAPVGTEAGWLVPESWLT